MNTIQKIKYAILSLRAVTFLARHPIFGARLFWKRLVFLFTRRFVGETLKSPITGEPIFNIQSLINAWAMQAIQELGTEWHNDIRETVAPVVVDVGANIGQFGKLVLALNPSAQITVIDPAPGMEKFNKHAQCFYDCAIGSSDGLAFLTQGEYWTASTKDGFYSGREKMVLKRPLDSIAFDAKKKITLLKIDVDGAEIEVLEGAANHIRSCKWIIIEVNSPEALAALPSGFKWGTINGHDWIGRRIAP